MANLGNAWHIPGSPEPPGRAGMRDPVGGIFAGTAVTIFSGNQFRGAGNPGNQLQAGSSLFFKRAADAGWAPLPLRFHRTAGNNKYYAATIPAGTFQAGDVVQYYLRIAYDDHATTFVHARDGRSTPTADEATAQATPFTFPVENSAVKGQWGPVFKLPNVAVHAHVLPNGRVLMWGRRDNPNDSLDVHECTPFVWNPQDGQTTNTPQPKLADGTKVNLFCSGHAFLPDGRLLVVGGHLADSDGLNQATLYDWTTNTWTPTAPMTTPMGEQVRRWYPTATTLPNGNVLVLSGSYIDPTRPQGKQVVVVDLLQVWESGTWKTIRKTDGTPLNFIGLPLYPRMHVASDGRVFMSGTNARTLLLNTSQPGQWTEVGFRALGNRDYCPAVMYDVDKVIYIGGGNEANTHTPTAEVEIIDLSANPRQWRKTNPMKFPRRQHNATLLPDGTVLVTGGTRGGSGPNNGFNDLKPGEPVHVAELWDPATKKWTELAAEAVDRCYHATAVLLPDATVLSAGSGEYRPDNVNPNDPEDSHRDAQIFSPPYLFKGERPEITSAPDSVSYGESFEVHTSRPNDIGTVSWVRLPSVTHSFDENQRINILQFQAGAEKLTVTAPNSPNLCPPGHYMLFILSQAGVPSIAKMIQMQAAVAPAALAPEPLVDVEATPVPETALSRLRPVVSEPRAYLQVYAREAEVAEAAKGTAVVVGITGTCPYGIGACWGGAYEALRRLEGVDLVSPVPNTDDSTAEVFLEDERLPALDTWDQQFRSIVNGTYEMRGVEVTLQGGIEARDGQLFLAGSGQRPSVQLAPLPATDKIQWNHTIRDRKPLEGDEALAYERLAAASRNLPDGQSVTVTGPLKQTDVGYQLHVRLFQNAEIV
jgi:galactose oxidase